MQPHEERVIIEKKELDEKIDKLKAFIMENPVFKRLSIEEQKRLNQQYDIMIQYSKILNERINAFIS